MTRGEDKTTKTAKQASPKPHRLGPNAHKPGLRSMPRVIGLSPRPSN